MSTTTTYTPLIEKQIKLYKKYGITDYTIVNNKITINSSVYLYDESIDVDTFKNVYINGNLVLVNLTNADVGMFDGTYIYGYLNLSSLDETKAGVFKGLVVYDWIELSSLFKAEVGTFDGLNINGGLSLESLTNAEVGLFIGLNLNGYLDLSSLTKVDDGLFNGLNLNGSLTLNSVLTEKLDLLNGINHNGKLYINYKSIKSVNTKLTDGYNKKRGYCYFDGILRSVLSVKTIGEYKIYLTPFDYVVQKGDYTAHAESIEKGISDVNFKILAIQYQENLTLDTMLNKHIYRLITGACELGCNDWIRNNNIQVEEISVRDLIPLLEKTNAYGVEKIKNLVK